MRKLVFGALLLGSLGMASGCFISSDDDDDDDSGGRFSMTWDLESGGAEITCANAGVDGVRHTATGSTGTVHDCFTCENRNGTTGFLPLDDYTVTVSVIDVGDCGTAASLGDSMPRGASLVEEGVTVDHGNFVFDFGASGDVDFLVDFGGTVGTNCDDLPTGEGVVSQLTTLTLDGGGQCISVELLVNSVSDLDDICARPTACVEVLDLQTLVDVAPGDYVLTIDGIVDGAVSCFTWDEPFSVTDGFEDLGSIVVPLDTDVCI